MPITLTGLTNPRSVAVPLAVIAAGLVFAAVAWRGVADTHAYADGSVATGTVTGVDQREEGGNNSDATVTCTARIAYQVGGTSYVVDSGDAVDVCAVPIGATVDVSYRAERPHEGRAMFPASTDSSLKIAAGLGFALIGVVMLLFAVRLRSRRPHDDLVVVGDAALPPPPLNVNGDGWP